MTTAEDREQVRSFHADFNKVPPPLLPPPPVNSGAATIAGAGAGAVDGAVLGVLLSSRPEMMDGLTKSPILWWIVLGAIVGGIFGGVGSLIYNAIRSLSSNARLLKTKLPDAQGFSNDQVLFYWTDLRVANLYHHIKENFMPKPK